MSNILITGASGFIGSNLARKLVKSKNQISVIYRKQSNLWRIKDIISDLDVHMVDLDNFNALKQKIKKIKPDIVYHFATYGVYPSQTSITTMIKTNITCTINLMHVLNDYGTLDKFVNLGSSFEYGPKTNAIKENQCVNPVSPYSITKVSQTQFAKYYATKYNFSIVTLRLFYPYGMYEQPGRLISDIMSATIQNKILSLSSPYPRRDFIFIDDVINALLKVTKTPKINGEIFNIGGGREYSVGEIVNLVQKITHKDIQISYDDKNQRDFDKLGGRGFTNLEKTKKILNWKPTHSIKQGLAKTYDWYKKHIELYK